MTTQEKLIEYCEQDIIHFLIQDKNIDWDKAMQMFYLSSTFEKLQDTSTELYRESSSYVYDFFNNELENGKIIQDEI